MRLKEEDNNWRASSIKRRDYRHTYGDPEVPRHKKQKQNRRKPKTKIDHKHVWVEVEYREYCRYRDKVRHYWAYWWQTNMESSYWREYTTYFVCADCLDTKVKIDKGKQRIVHRKKWQ